MLGAGAVYVVVLREPGWLFYVFAVLFFAVSPLIGAVMAVRETRTKKIRTFYVTGGGLFGLAGLGFVLTYAVFPVFERTSVQLPEFCGEFGDGLQLPASFVYELPGVGATTLITSDAQTALAAAIDFEHAPFPSTVYLVQKSNGQILWRNDFANDSISAAIEDGTLYLYNDKIGYWIDTRTGLPKNNVFTIDNYGGLSQTDRPVIGAGAGDGHWYLETTAVISSWRADGSVVSRGHVTFNSIAFHCFIDGRTGLVTGL